MTVEKIIQEIIGNTPNLIGLSLLTWYLVRENAKQEIRLDSLIAKLEKCWEDRAEVKAKERS